MATVKGNVTSIAARAENKKWQLLAVFLAVFFVSFSFLSFLDIVPEKTPVSVPQVSVQTVEAEEEYIPRAPSRIIIDKIGVDTPVLNPESTDIKVLDTALREGVVRYPGSALLGEDASMFFFGHSSYLPIIHNKAYKAFNNLDKLSNGDMVRVRSEGREYLYRVKSVVLVDADSAFVELQRGKRTLTLSTCNSFGEKSERFVVEAEYIGSQKVQG